jgi:hypothetical protein
MRQIFRSVLLEMIADNLSKAGWNRGCISSTDHKGRQFWVAAAERGDAGFIVRADESCLRFSNWKGRVVSAY